jgi:Domain of unknown function (DUF4383)
VRSTAHVADRRSTLEKRPAFIQVLVFGISLAFLSWSVAGLIANPDFATGTDATTKQVLGIDFNGWHAVSGVALFGPGLFFALRKDWALLFALAAIVSLVASGAWALLDTRPANVLYFKHNRADAALHFGSAAAYGLAVLVYWLQGRRRRGAARPALVAAPGGAD